MNRPAIEALIQQYRTDPSIIFQMPKVIEEVDCGSAFCIAGQVCINAGWGLTAVGEHAAWARKEGPKIDALRMK